MKDLKRKRNADYFDALKCSCGSNEAIYKNRYNDEIICCHCLGDLITKKSLALLASKPKGNLALVTPKKKK